METFENAGISFLSVDGRKRSLLKTMTLDDLQLLRADFHRIKKEEFKIFDQLQFSRWKRRDQEISVS